MVNVGYAVLVRKAREFTRRLPIPSLRDRVIRRHDMEIGSVKQAVIKPDYQKLTISFESGYVRVGTLSIAKDTRIYGILLKAGEVEFAHNGRLYHGTLSGDQVIQGISCKGGTEIQYWTTGWLAHAVLSKRQKVQGLIFEGGTEIHFRHNGKVYSGILSDPLRVGETLFLPRSEVTLNSEGDLIEVKLKRAQKIRGSLYKAGTYVAINQSGMGDITPPKF